MSSTVEIGGRAFTVRDLTEADKPDLLALHEQVFGPGASEAWYRWKYLPGGHGGKGNGAGSGVWHEGQLIAHCGGIPRMLLRHGQPVSGVQIGDVMVGAQWRGILTRRGPFFHASQAFYASHVGATGLGQIAFGFPSERHLRLAVTSRLLWSGGPIHALTWLLQTRPAPLSRWAWCWDELDPSHAGFDARIDAAWALMQARCGALTVGERRAAYVRWRFCDRPGRKSRFFALRRPWSRRPVGIAVLDLESPNAQWLDWIGRIDHIGTAARACQAQAAQAGAASLMAWTSPAVTQSLQNTGISDTTVTAWLGIPQASSLSEAELPGLNWWLMGGDTDFL